MANGSSSYSSNQVSSFCFRSSLFINSSTRSSYWSIHLFRAPSVSPGLASHVPLSTSDTAAMSHGVASTVWACHDISSSMPLLRFCAVALLILLELLYKDGGRVGVFGCAAPPFECSSHPPSIVCRLLLSSAIPWFCIPESNGQSSSQLMHLPPSCVPAGPWVQTPFPVVAPGECFMKGWFRAGGPFCRVFQDLPLELPLHPS